VGQFEKWSEQFEIDGIIIEINNLDRQEELGREGSRNNPVWARAYKAPEFEMSAETRVIGLTYGISKQGYLKPVLHIDPVQLDGVTVSNVTGNNARFIKNMGLGIGAKVRIVRSGMVIPKIVDVFEKVDFIEPIIEGVDLVWNTTGVELMTVGKTDAQILKSVIAFFEILEATYLGPGIITQLYDAGYVTIKQILEINIDDLEKIDGFGKRKSLKVYDSVKNSVSGVKLSKLQHASGLFLGLGSRKLSMLEHFVQKPTIDEVMSIDGFAETSSKSYVENYDIFFDFIKDLPIVIKTTTVDDVYVNDLDGVVFVFTGVRMKNEESVLESRGAKIGSSVSKNTTYLVCKDIGSTSSKIKKARSLDVVILDVSGFLDLFFKEVI